MAQKVDPTRTPGAFEAPPPEAPRQVADNTNLGPTPEQIARARANEQQLEPLTFRDSVVPAAPAVPAVPAVAVVQPAAAVVPAAVPPQTLVDPTGRPITSSFKGPDIPLRKPLRRAGGRRPDPVAAPAESVQVQAQAEPAVPAADAPPTQPEPGADAPTHLTEADLRAAGARPPEPYRPAASDTDSPSRGIPRPVDDPGKRITGGFGDAGEAQYFPLDGTELRELVYALMDQIHAQLMDDLRFSIAVTYPRVTARVVVEVQAYPVDNGFTVPKVMRPYEKTPLEVARQVADECVFVVVAERREMTEEGESVAPPNQTRQELGLEIPRKQFISTGVSKTVVDRTT